MSLIEELNNPELCFPGNFDTSKRANALLLCLCQTAADRIEALEQLAKDMAEALEEQSRVTFESQMVDFHVCCDRSDREDHADDCAVTKALSRYREVCGGEK